MENKRKCFIKTTDEETKNKLLAEGFVLAGCSNGEYTFINDINVKFSNNENIVYSDKLTF